MQLAENQLRLIDHWQRGFPLAPDPYSVIGESCGMTGSEVISCLKQMKRQGVLSRVGATVRPNTAGASTLAAMRVPHDRFEAVAALVNGEPGVNHNYEREHDFNLWFVAAGRDRASVAKSLERIEEVTGLEVLDLPLERAYFIDLGFSIRDGLRKGVDAFDNAPVRQTPVSDVEKRLLISLEDGLPLESQPFSILAQRLGLSEHAYIDLLRNLIDVGIVTRFGLIVRHRELGFSANAMVVWNVDDRLVDDIGQDFAAQPYVTLCYRRPRRRPVWPYNLFCMIHGRERQTVLDQIEQLRGIAKLEDSQPAILFSKRRFKQRGAQLSAA